MGWGGKKFWRSVAEIGLSVAPGGALVKAGGGLVISQFLKPDSEEQKQFKIWVEFVRVLDNNKHMTEDRLWEVLVAKVTDELEDYYGEVPKLYDIMYNASAALKEARKEFEE